MRLKLIAGGTLSREIGFLSAACPNTLDITWLQQEERTPPSLMGKSLQQAIDAAEDCQVHYDAIAVGAGLWEVWAALPKEGPDGSAVSPVHSERYPLIVPRAHDSVTLLLGSKERYREFVGHHDGICWLTPGRMERGFRPEQPDLPGGCSTAVYIKNDDIFQPDWREEAQSAARCLHWDFEELPGNLRLLRNLLWGSWDEEDFLTLLPGQRLRPSLGRQIVEIAR